MNNKVYIWQSINIKEIPSEHNRKLRSSKTNGANQRLLEMVGVFYI